MMSGQSTITPEMAQQELSRRQAAKEELNRRKLSPNLGQSEFDPSFLQKLAPNALAGFAEMGHNLINAPHNLVNMISPRAASHIPQQPNYDFSEMLKLPNTTADKMVQGLAANLPSVLMPEAKIGQLPLVGKAVSSAVGRILPQAGFGAVTSEDPLKGAGEMAAMQGIGETIPGIVKGIGGAAEFLNPKKYAEKLAETLSKKYNSAKTEASNLYDSVNQKYGDFILSIDPKKYLGFSKSTLKRFTPEIKKSYEEFLSNPSFKKAHELQSQIFKDSNSIKGNSNKINTYQSLNNARENVKGKINKFLSRDENSLNNYSNATNITRDEVSPYTYDKSLKKIIDGKVKEIQPKKLSTSIQKAVETGEKNKMKNHFLSQALEELNKKINKGKAAQDIGSVLGGVALGESVAPGLAGGAAGAALAKFLSPTLVKLAQNPSITGSFEKLNPYYEKLKNSIIATQFNNRD